LLIFVGNKWLLVCCWKHDLWQAFGQ
jgi:hypothetical protein